MGAKQSTPPKLKSIEEIVFLAKSRQVPLIPKDSQHRMYMTNDDEDDLKPLKSVATDLVVEQFFQTDTTLYRFLNLIYTHFEEALKIYRTNNGISENDLFFMYKGGNILRFVSKEFMLQIPAVAHEELKQYYLPFFKRSDADFSIFIHPDLENYMEVHDDMGLLSYLLQDRIRSIFMSDLGYYFDFLRYSIEYRSKILENYLPKFNESGHEYNRISFLDEDYVPQEDFVIKLVSKNKAIRYNTKKSNSPITISYNDALWFYTGVEKNRPSHFKLVRSKVFFNLIDKRGNRVKIGGELIDVGIDYPDDVKNIHLLANFENALQVYSLKHKECELEFISYTIANLVYDLEEILFEKAIFPWEDPKYGKRINRLFYMYFVDAFIRLSNGQERMEVFTALRDYFIGIIEDNERDLSIREDLEVSKLVPFIEIVNERAKTKDERGQIQVLLELLIQNSNFTLSSLEQIKEYCSADGTISVDDIYSAEASDII